METFMTSDLAMGLTGLVLTGLTIALGLAIKKLISSIKASSNKLDDEALPLLQSISEAIEEAKKNK